MPESYAARPVLFKEITFCHLKDRPVRLLSESAARSGIRRIFHFI